MRLNLSKRNRSARKIHAKRSRRLQLESLEQKRLLAADQALFFDDFDPITPSNFEFISDGNVTGATSPTQFHDGNALYFNGIVERSVTTTPISISEGTISFRLRLGNVRFPFENIDPSEEVVLEGTVDNGSTWILLNEFSATAPRYSSADVWDLAEFNVPADLASDQTQFRLRQKSHTGTNFDNWAIDDLFVTGQPFEITIDKASPVIRNTPVGSLNVSFRSVIDASTFDVQDIKLTRNNVDVPLTSAVTVVPIGPKKFKINGLSAFNTVSGDYQLTVLGAGITDTLGKSILSQSSTGWTLDLDAPQVVDVVDVSPDPRTGRFKAVSSIDVLFSEPIDFASFDFSDITLTRDGGSNLIDSTVIIEWLSDTRARIKNLELLTNNGGLFTLTVGGDVTDIAGNIGTHSQSDSWLSNDPARIALSGSVLFHEGSAPRVISNAAIVQDIDTPIMNNGSLTVDFSGRPVVGDHLGILIAPTSITQISTRGNRVFYVGVPIGTFTGGDHQTPLVVKFNSAANLDAVRNLVRSVTYQYVGEVIAQQTRIGVRMVINDGEGGISFPEIKPVTLVPVNDAPVLRLNATSATYVSSASAVPLAPTATLTDVDNPTLFNASLTVTVASGRKNNENLQLSGNFTISGTQLLYKSQDIGLVVRDGSAGVPLVLRFNAQATLAIVNELLTSLTFSTTAEKSFTTRTLSFEFRDGKGGVDSSQSITVNVKK